VALKGSGGWSEKLAGTFIDDRKRVKIELAEDAKVAADLAIKLAQKNQ
jgi:hypothetical protein